MEDISHIDVFTVLMILILVGLFFRSFVTSAMPPVTMGVAFAVTMGLIYGLMYFMDIFFITEVMLLVSMMGAGCDYCIFILARYREERRDGKDHHDALHSAIKWAGESITISGASVIIGFGAMSICSFSMISTMGRSTTRAAKPPRAGSPGAPGSGTPTSTDPPGSPSSTPRPSWSWRSS